MSKKILLVLLEFDSWKFARHWTYNASYGFIDGLEENGCSCTVLPALFNSITNCNEGSDKLLDNADAILKGEIFDEAWVWCVHKEYSEKFWRWINAIAPIRIGFVMESMNYHDEIEILQFPHLMERKRKVLDQLKHCTHAIVADEQDIPLVNSECSIPAVWFPTMVSEQFVRYDDAPKAPNAFFIGSAYSARKPYLEDPLVKTLLIRPDLPEYDSEWPDAYDSLHISWHNLLSKTIPTRIQLNDFVYQLHYYRRNLFNLALDGTRLGFANVNLPSIFRAYPARVVESMAASTPVVTYVIKDRVKCAKLFVKNKEIIVFDSPKKLYLSLKNLHDNVDLRNQLIIAARKALLARHTSRVRMKQYRLWIDQNIEPNFFEDTSK